MKTYNKSIKIKYRGRNSWVIIKWRIEVKEGPCEFSYDNSCGLIRHYKMLVGDHFAWCLFDQGLFDRRSLVLEIRQVP